jgi:predicted phosphodiesterase
VRLGLISDIHGNRLALDAVLNELEREGVDEFVCLGDVAVGPQPAEAIQRVRELGCPVVMGNWDAAFLGDMPTPKDKIGEQLVEIGQWWASYLSDGRSRVHGRPSSPRSGSRSVDAGALLPRLAAVLRRVDLLDHPDDGAEGAFADIEERVLVGGHTHVR